MSSRLFSDLTGGSRIPVHKVEWQTQVTRSLEADKKNASVKGHILYNTV